METDKQNQDRQKDRRMEGQTDRHFLIHQYIQMVKHKIGTYKGTDTDRWNTET